jgi:hypothetical protein
MRRGGAREAWRTGPRGEAKARGIAWGGGGGAQSIAGAQSVGSVG